MPRIRSTSRKRWKLLKRALVRDTLPPRFDRLISDPAVGHKFAVANVTQERPQGGGPIRLLLKDRELLEERAKLVSKIQALLIFDSFLTSEEYVSNDGDVTSRSFDTYFV